MNFKEAMQKGVEWGSVIMAGATLALGSAMTNAEIGLTDWLSGAIAPHPQRPARLAFDSGLYRMGRRHDQCGV